MVSEKAIEDLLNSLGKQLAMDYYGLDLNFTVVEVGEKYGFTNVLVKTDKQIPMTFDVKIEPNMNAGRFARIGDLMGNLAYLMKYLGIKNANVEIPQEQTPERYQTVVTRDDFIKHPQDYVELESVGHVLEKDTGYIYPLYQNGKIEPMDSTHLSEIYEDDWWDSLSPEDIHTLENIYR
jgi:hypothetical protein